MAHIDLNDSIINQVRDAADIVDFVGQVTPLKAAGKSFKGLCPFHREKTPSFQVDRGKGLFYCFGCGTGGDLFKFLTLTERFSFPEAVEYVANRLGIPLPTRRRTSKDDDREDLVSAIEDAAEAWHQALGWTPNAAERYLAGRGVDAEIWDRYGFGFAPDSWDYLLTRLGSRHPAARLEGAGLVLPKKTGQGHYDRFRSRLMIPIHSESGTLIGFGGRALDGGEPKYLNSPESEVFNKSNLLYNLHRAKDRIRKLDRAILVEGYFDAISLDHAGVPGVVASMGTSLTPGQASLLRRYSRRVAICYDGDSAGRHAVLRAAPILLSAGVSVDVVDIGEGVDPDDLIRNTGIDGFMERLAGASDIFAFALSETVQNPADLTGREKAEKLDALVPLLTAVSDPVIRNEAAQRIADALRLEFGPVWSRVRQRGTTGPVDRDLSAPISTGEKNVLRALLHGEAPPEILERLSAEFFEDPVCRSIFEKVEDANRNGLTLDFLALATHLRGDAELTRLSELALSSETDPTDPAALGDTLLLMERRHLARRLMEIQHSIQEAIREGNVVSEQSLMLEKIKLSKRLHQK